MRSLFVSAALATLAALAACSPYGASEFHCALGGGQCGAGGVCEDTRYCSFEDPTCPGGRKYGDFSGALSGQCTGGEPMLVDAGADAPSPLTCTAGVKQCFGNAVETCNATGTGFDSGLREACGLSCEVIASAPTCTKASGLSTEVQVACGTGANDKDLQAPAGARVTIKNDRIDCTGCAGGVTTIPRAGTNPNAWFCLKSLVLSEGAQVGYEADTVITLFVAQSATIDTTVGFGGHAGELLRAGTGGPGGSSGGGLSGDNQDGVDGRGSCPGQGGAHVNTGADAAGGGGGGAGHAGVGGAGGKGIGKGTPNPVAAGGGDGGPASTACDSPLGYPLKGGSGGGGGGDGSCGNNVGCGASGGGGGGGLQIAVRGDLGGSGSIRADGGDGSQGLAPSAGAGGGGAGGTIMIEAHAFTMTGALDVTGGNGGAVANRAGGMGATTVLAGGVGTNGIAVSEGGSGGGGAAGRVRVNAAAAPNACTAAKPVTACSAGALTPQ